RAERPSPHEPRVSSGVVMIPLFRDRQGDRRSGERVVHDEKGIRNECQIACVGVHRIGGDSYVAVPAVLVGGNCPQVIAGWINYRPVAGYETGGPGERSGIGVNAEGAAIRDVEELS